METLTVPQFTGFEIALQHAVPVPKTQINNTNGIPLVPIICIVLVVSAIAYHSYVIRATEANKTRMSA